MVKDGIEDCLQRLLSREKFNNICLQDSMTKAKKELTKEKVEREALECQYLEMQERVKMTHKLDLEYRRLKQKQAELEKDQKKFYDQTEWLKNREEEIIKRLDLNEIDLITERLDIYGVEGSKKKLPKKRVKHKIPPLDMERLEEMKNQDEMEYEEEEEEQEEDMETSQGQYLQDGSQL